MSISSFVNAGFPRSWMPLNSYHFKQKQVVQAPEAG